MDFAMTPDNESVRKMVREFAEKDPIPHAQELDETERFPWENLKGLAGLGAFAIKIPEK